MIRTIGLFAALAVCAMAGVDDQVPASAARYSITREVSLSAQTEVVTLQIPAVARVNVYPIGISVRSTAATTMSVERNGSSATGTAITPVPLNTSVQAPEITAVHTSTSSGGAVIRSYTIPANAEFPVSMYNVVLRSRQPAVQNLTLRFGSMSGTLNVLVVYAVGE